MKAKTKLKFYEGCHTIIKTIENCVAFPLYWIGFVIAMVIMTPLDWLNDKIYERERDLWGPAWEEMEKEKEKAAKNVPNIP